MVGQDVRNFHLLEQTNESSQIKADPQRMRHKRRNVLGRFSFIPALQIFSFSQIF